MLIVWKIWRASLSYYLRFEIRPVTLLPTNVRIRFENIVSEQVCEISKKLLIKNTKIKTVCILIKIIIFKVYDESLNYPWDLFKVHYKVILEDRKVSLSWRRSLSYRNQSIGFLCKSMDWFLYDRNLCHKRFKLIASSPNVTNFCEQLCNFSKDVLKVSLSIPLEIIRKPLVFCFQGV